MKVWTDQDCCTGAGRCVDHCPELFVILDDGIAYLRTGLGDDGTAPATAVAVPERSQHSAIDAALACPGECIYVDDDRV